MKMKKRLLSILLSIALVLGLMPGMSLTAYAEGQTVVWSGEKAVTQDNPVSIDKDKFSGIKLGDKIVVEFKDADGGLLSLFSNGKCLPGTSYNYVGSWDSAYEVFATQDMIKSLKQYGMDVSGYGYTVTKVSYEAGRDNLDVNTVWSGNFWMDSWSTLELSATSFSDVDWDEIEAIRFISEAGRSNWTLNIRSSWDDDGKIADQGSMTWKDNYFELSLDKIDMAAKLENKDRLYIQGDKDGGEAFNFTQVQLVPKPSHTHSFTYAASGTTITATCTADGCTLPLVEGKHIATLTIAAPLHTTYGDSKDATAVITDDNSIQGEAKVQYQKKTDGSYGTATESAPTDAGDYKASITVGGATASVEYTSAKATTTITTTPTAGEITYGQKLADSLLTDGEASVAGGFTWKDDTVAPAVADSQKTEYDVVFTPTDENYGTAICKVKLTVNKTAATVTKAPKAKSLTYIGSAQELVTEGEATDGEMQYALGNETEATQPYTTSIPTGTNAGTYYVWYMVKGDNNHNDTKPASVKVSIAKRRVTLTSGTATKVYDGKALTNNKVTVSGDGWAKGEGATYKVTGSQTKVGKSNNKFSYTLKSGTDAKNYNIVTKTGTLTVTEPVVRGTFIHIKSITQKNNKLQINWTKVGQADGYDVYVQYCTKKYADPVKTIKKNTTTQLTIAKLNGTKIDLTKAFKIYVSAYKMVKGKKTVLAKTVTSHVVGIGNAKYTNQKALKLTKSAFDIKAGKTAKIKVSATLMDGKKKIIPKDHGSAFKFRSSNTHVATVDKDGKITAKTTGTCYIFVYGISGLMKKVTVTVK